MSNDPVSAYMQFCTRASLDMWSMWVEAATKLNPQGSAAMTKWMDESAILMADVATALGRLPTQMENASKPALPVIPHNDSGSPIMTVGSP